MWVHFVLVDVFLETEEKSKPREVYREGFSASLGNMAQKFCQNLACWQKKKTEDTLIGRVQLHSAGRAKEAEFCKDLEREGIIRNREFSLFSQICFIQVFPLSQA